MSNPAPTLNQINAFNATIGTTIDFNIIGGTEVIRSNKIYIYDLSDNSLICTHLYVSTESIHELPPNTSSSIVYASGKSSADFTNNTQYYAQIQTFTDTNGTQGASGLSIAKLFWCLPTPTLTLSTIPTTISTTSYNVSATYTPNTSGGATNEIQEFQFNLYSAIGALLQTSGVVLYGEGVDLSYNFSGLEVDSTYYVTLDVTTTQGMNVSAQSNTFTVSIDTPTMGSASVVNNGCDGYISVTSNLSSEYSHSYSVDAGEIMSFTTDSPNNITKLQVDFNPIQNGTPWMSTPNTEPYTFRAVPTQTEDFGHESDTIVGGTVAWNQLVQNGNFENTSHWTAYSNATINGASGGVLTFTVSGSNGGILAANPSRIFPTPANEHKYIAIADIKLTTATTAVKMRLNGGYKQVYTKSTTEWQTLSCIYNLHNSDNGYLQFGDERTSGWDAIQLKNVMVVDLTQMFGSTIADYIYSLEQATAGAGVAWFRKLFPKDYYAYDAGSLVSVSGLTSHDMVGFNQWDEEWERGGINQTTGANTSNSNAIRSKNYIRVVPNTTYYVKAPIAVRGYWYDADKNYINTDSLGVNTTFTVPSGACYLRFIVGNSTTPITTYGNNICINLSWDGERDGEYEAYVKHSYPLDSDLTLRGIPKLDASNNLYYDGDTYESDGTVNRRYGIVDLGTLTWNIYNGKFTSVLNLEPLRKTDGNINMLCPKYITGVFGSSASQGDKKMWLSASTSSNTLWVEDSAYSDAATFKAAMSGVYLVYELATPTTETADPYTNPQIVDPSGTEEYVGSSIPVGHKTTYQRICPITGWTGCEVINDPAYGGYVYWNQIAGGVMRNAQTKNGIQYTPNGDGSFTLNGTADASDFWGVTPYPATGMTVAGHKYYIADGNKNGSATTFGLGFGSGTPRAYGDTAVIMTATTNNFGLTYYYQTGAVINNAIIKPMMIDLTALFGEGNEPSTVEEFKAIFPNDYYAYNAGEKTNVSAVNGTPYGEYNITWQTEAGTVYGGTINLVTGVLTVTNGYVELDGSNDEDWAFTSGFAYYRGLRSTAKAGAYSVVPNILCDKLETVAYGQSQGKVSWISIDNGKDLRIKAGGITDVASARTWLSSNSIQVTYELATPKTYQLTPHQIQTLVGQNNLWSDTNGEMTIMYQLPITDLLVKRKDVSQVGSQWLTLHSVPITQASDMDFTFIDFLNQYGKTYQYALVPVLAQDQSGVIVQIEGGYTVSDNVDSIFDGVYIADQTNVERVKAGVGYGNVDMNQNVGTITPIGSKYPIVITNSQNQYHNGSVRGTIVPNDFYSNGNLSRIDMVNKRDELEQFLTNKRAKIIKDWNGKMWLVMIMSNVSCTFDDNYGMGIVSFNADWVEVGDPTNQQDLYNAGLINVGGV